MAEFRNDLYDKSYSHDWNPTKIDNIRIKKSLNLLDKKGKILDVGCFDGTISEKISALTGNDVFGLEISRPAVLKANKKNVKVIRHDIEKPFPIKDSAFDAVFAGEIIEHLYDVDLFLDEINRVLKKGGYLILTTPNLLSFWNRFRAVIGLSFIDFNKDKQHIRFFTKKVLTELLEKHGFEIEKISDSPLAIPILSRFDVIFERSAFNLGEHVVLRAKKI